MNSLEVRTVMKHFCVPEMIGLLFWKASSDKKKKKAGLTSLDLLSFRNPFYVS